MPNNEQDTPKKSLAEIKAEREKALAEAYNAEKNIKKKFILGCNINQETPHSVVYDGGYANCIDEGVHPDTKEEYTDEEFALINDLYVSVSTGRSLDPTIAKQLLKYMHGITDVSRKASTELIERVIFNFTQPTTEEAKKMFGPKEETDV